MKEHTQGGGERAANLAPRASRQDACGFPRIFVLQGSEPARGEGGARVIAMQVVSNRLAVMCKGCEQPRILRLHKVVELRTDRISRGRDGRRRRRNHR